MKDEEVLRIAEGGEAADQIRRHDLQNHGVFDVELGEPPRRDGERDHDEQRHVVRHQHRQEAGDAEHHGREAAGVIEASRRLGHRQLQPFRLPQDLHGDQEREEDEQQIDVDGVQRGLRRDAAGDEKESRDDGDADNQHQRRVALGARAARMAIIAAPSTGVCSGEIRCARGAAALMLARIGPKSCSPAKKAPPT